MKTKNKNRTVAFKQRGSKNHVFVTIKDNFLDSVVVQRAWEKLSEHLTIPVNELKKDYIYINKIQLWVFDKTSHFARFYIDYFFIKHILYIYK